MLKKLQSKDTFKHYATQNRNYFSYSSKLVSHECLTENQFIAIVEFPGSYKKILHIKIKDK